MGEKPIVAFLGPEASYTHQATLSTFPESLHTIKASVTIQDVFTAVSSGAAQYGVVPFENSSNGSVIFTLDLLKGPRFGEDVRVDGEVYLPVRHCLLGTGDAVEAVKKVYSHPQAWGQCTRFLNEKLKSAERLDQSSTSKAAELVSISGDVTTAAIASTLAAQIYPNLKILAEGIEDNPDNATRFLVLQRKDSPEEGHDSLSGEDFKTLVSFTVSQFEQSGSLADCLAVFKKYDLNLTSINSRPSGRAPWHYVFFVEFQGRKAGQGEGGAVNEALEELGKVAESWRWLGSWKNQLKSRKAV